MKNAEMTQRSHAYRGYASNYCAEILNFLNHELQLKDTESIIRDKLEDLLSELRRFKFVATIALEFKK